MLIRLDNTAKIIFSEFWVNIAAGWFGAGIIVPLSTGESLTNNFGMLTVDIFFGIVSLVIAYTLRKNNKK